MYIRLRPRSKIKEDKKTTSNYVVKTFFLYNSKITGSLVKNIHIATFLLKSVSLLHGRYVNLLQK